MKSFRHITPPLRIHQGPDCLAALEPELQRLGCQRAVIFCGQTLANDPGLLEPIQAAAHGRLAGVYTGVKADTPLPHVENAVEELRRLNADAIIAIGGGSAITTARAANILQAESGSAHTLCTRRTESGELHSPKLLAPKLPILAIPSTPTTATVKAGSAILDTVEGKRLALYDPKARTKAVFIHPGMIASAPRDLVLSASLNTFALALEGLMSRRGDPIADAMLIHAVRLIAQNLPAATSSDDLEVRGELMVASLLAGHGSDYTGAGMAIPIGHAISTQFAIGMGTSDAIMLPHVVRFNAQAAAAGLRKIATALDVADRPEMPLSERLAQTLRRLFASVGVPDRLRDVGVTQASLPELAAICFDDWYLQSNPRRITDAAEVQHILELAW
ncbi:MAG: iron-containing alcohol dehydrogenase family protein [Pigmentiphaga sp.]